MKFGRIRRIHFVGIGGIGMSGIAEILSNYDLEISGCDLSASENTDRMAERGIGVSIGHAPSHLEDIDLVVVSSAIRPNNAEIAEARERRIPVIRRAEMLGELMRLKRGVAIAGTHGKTTTSAMTAEVLSGAGLDPTLIVGGVLLDLSSSARLGAGELLVVEADEYDRSFLTLQPEIAVVTNIEIDHLDIYRDLEDIRGTFDEFLARVPFYGVVVGCSDDELVDQLLSDLSKRVVRYGFGEDADVRGMNVRFEGGKTACDVTRDGETVGSIELEVPGRHNLLNALAATAVGLELDVPFEKIRAGLADFRGVERRFEILGEWQGAIVVDDYAHHPTEVRKTLEAARETYRDRKIVVIFQPHLFSRTRDFHEDFAEALGVADQAWVVPIYPAREDPIEGVTSSLIVDSATRKGIGGVDILDEDLDGVLEFIRNNLGEQSLVMTMGAGDIHEVGERLVGGAL
ncbi:MAG: UDP-N-acetylmuramate--L-alanine ligase [Thermoanaerobaculia bacterium]|nr:UDP-N-acetylmuramate--L-alanine ligase [Thermoanaerobaculia bacterium]